MEIGKQERTSDKRLYMTSQYYKGDNLLIRLLKFFFNIIKNQFKSMGSEAFTPQYIIVLGTTYSGSGAIFDYLSKRGDLHDPLNGQATAASSAPWFNGVRVCSWKAFHPAISTAALNNFEHTVKSSLEVRTFGDMAKHTKIVCLF